MKDNRRAFIDEHQTTEIRLFISSTFVDMQEERERFNNRIFPRLQRLCRDKGVSFFTVDLRWGVAEEDIKNNQLVRLCLNEVDKCRPFFLGIIGNRYGSSMENVPDELLEEYPWLSEKSGASYTDLEITYNFIKSKNPDNMLFMFRECRDGEVEDPRVSSLKGFIREKAKDHISTYDSLDVFEEEIVKRFCQWLDILIGDTDVHLERERLYERELMGQCTRNEKEEKSIEECIRISDSTVLVHGQGPLGKTSLLNSIAHKWQNSVIINCAADEANGDWQYVVCSIYNKLSGLVDFPDEEKKWFDNLIRTGISNENELAEHCRAMLEGATCKNDTLLVINDIEFIFGTRTRYLLWIPTVTKNSFHIACSSNHPDFINSAKMLDWTLLEMRPMESSAAAELLSFELERVGKSPKTASPLLNAPLACYPGFLKISIDFLNCFGSYDTIGELSSLLAGCADFGEFYKTIFEYIPKKYSEETAKDLLLTLGAVALSPEALDEAGRYLVLQKINGASKVRWAAITELLSALRLMEAGGTVSSELRNVMREILTDDEKKQIYNALGEYRLSLADIDNFVYDRDRLEQLVRAIYHFSNADNFEAITSILKDRNLVAYLSVYDLDVLRRAYAELMLGTERNIAKLIASTMVSIAGDELDIRDTALLRLRFVYDELQLYDKTEDKKIEAVCKKIAHSGRAEAENDYSAVAYSVREVVFPLMQAKGLDAALRIVEGYASRCNSNQKRAAYMNIKAELLLKSRHQDALNGIEQALQQSIRAASVLDILYAYDLKAGELIRLMRYEEAEYISRTGLRWAEDLGYVFYQFAFANHIMVCLYRNELYDEAISLGTRCMERCKRFIHQEHRATFAIGIANAYNLGGKYAECIEFTEKQLADKELRVQHRVHLSEALAAAYFNEKKYHRSRKILTDLLKLNIADAGKRLMISFRLAMFCLMEECVSGNGVLTAKTAKLLNDTFGMAKKSGNSVMIHMFISQFYPFFLSSKEGKRLIEKWGDTENRDVYSRRISDPEGLFFTVSGLLSVKGNARAEANISGLVNDYTIALNREDRESALSAALALARCYEGTDHVQEAKWYLCAAKATEGEKGKKLLTNGVFAIMKEGRAEEPELLASLLEQMENDDKKAVELWQRIGDLPYNDDDTEILSYLSELLQCTKNTDLLNCCIADLAELLSNMSLRELHIFEDLAAKAGINGMLITDITHNGLKHTVPVFEKLLGTSDIMYVEDIEDALKSSFLSSDFVREYQKTFGDERRDPEKYKDLSVESVINDSGRFTFTQFMLSAQEMFKVVPTVDYDNIDDSVGTVSVNKASSMLMCTTDINSKYFSTAHRQRIDQVIEKVRAQHSHSPSMLAACRAGLECYGRVVCRMYIFFESESDLRKKFNEHAEFIIDLIVALDKWAAEL